MGKKLMLLYRQPIFGWRGIPYFNKVMTILFLIPAFLLILLFIVYIILLRTATHIGEQGRKNVILESSLGILEAILAIFLTVLMIIHDNGANKLLFIILLFIAVILLFSSVVVIKSLLKERDDNLITEYLINVRVYPFGYYNRDRAIEGLTDGKTSRFI